MDPALQKALGELLLNAVPTIVLFLLLFFCYTALVHRPLLKVLAERHAMTEGAVAKAQTDIAAADAKTAEYEQKLREARAAMFKELEQRRQRLLDARTQAISQARSEADARVKAAKSDIDKQAAQAKATLQTQGETLAQRVIDQVLHTSAAGGVR
jgi:F-type H+-transporting ATPase subunit b